MERIKEIEEKYSAGKVIAYRDAQDLWSIVHPDIEYLLAENKKKREALDKAHVLLERFEIMLDMDLVAENKRLTSVLEKIGFTFTDVDTLKAYRDEFEEWAKTQDKEVFYVDWYHYLAQEALKQE